MPVCDIKRQKKRISDALSRRRRWAKARKAAVTALGGRCNNPACEWPVLPCDIYHIDHVQGGGCQERKKNHSGAAQLKFHYEVVVSVQNNEGKYQLLCPTCNAWKRKLHETNRLHGFEGIEYLPVAERYKYLCNETDA